MRCTVPTRPRRPPSRSHSSSPAWRSTTASPFQPGVVNLLDFDRDALTAYCERLGEKPFRAVQLFRWIHHRGAREFEQMTDLARSLRERLPQQAHVAAPPRLSEQGSADGTTKWLFDVGGGDAVESVFIPEAERGTLC